jgi:AraC-like DNA-binding protein
MLSDRPCLDLAIIDIAFASGFRDVSHFNRVFRRRFGETPSGVRPAAIGHLLPSCAVPVDGSLSADSCRPGRMLPTAEMGQKQPTHFPHIDYRCTASFQKAPSRAGKCAIGRRQPDQLIMSPRLRL